MTLENTLKKILVGGSIIGSSFTLTGCGGMTDSKSITLDNAKIDHSSVDARQVNAKGPVLTGKYKVKGKPDGSWEAEGEGSPGSSSSTSGSGTIEDCADNVTVCDKYTHGARFVVKSGAEDSLYKLIENINKRNWPYGYLPDDNALQTYYNNEIKTKWLTPLSRALNDAKQCEGQPVFTQKVLEQANEEWVNYAPAGQMPSRRAPSNEEPADEAPPVQNTVQAGYGNRGFQGRTHPRHQRRDFLDTLFGGQRHYTPGGDVMSYHRGASAQYNQTPYSNPRGRR